jgi:putative ABC transport system permease protein
VRPVDLLLSALESLAANWLRSLLTALGVIIGVASLIAMMAVGAGASAQIDQMISNLGSNVITVFPGSAAAGGARLGGGSSSTLTDDDLHAIQADVEGVAAAAASLNSGAQLVAGNLNWSTQVSGVTEHFLAVNNWTVADGRGFEPAELRGARKLAILGDSTATALFPDGGALGQTVRIDRTPFTVIGVLKRKGGSLGFRDQDDVVMIPLEAARRTVVSGARARAGTVGSITVQGADAGALDELAENVAALLRQRHRIRAGADDDFTVRNFAEILAARTESTRVMTLLLAVVASISLVVGGIGIMNIMLVSVTERTREIGLRMAIGASPRAVERQFLLEALLLSVAGGVIGLALGAGATWATAALSGWTMTVDATSVALALGFSGATGLAFGYFPARRAARLDPIEALRTE